MSEMTAEWPTRGETPWDDKLRAYIDEAFGSVRGDVDLLLPKDDSLDLYLYGASYSVLANAFFTPGHHYAHILRDALGADSVTSYGVNGRRALDVASTLLQGVGFPGVLGVIAAGKWPGTPARRGIQIPDQLGNDVMNQASNNGGAITVQAITGAGGTAYLNYLRQTYRAAFALMSTETRIENHSHTAAVGTWTHETAGSYASGGTTCFTTTPNDYAEYSITPPQYGPNAGKAWFVVVGDLPSNLQYAAMQFAVDGVNQGTAITPGRHSYIAQGGATVKGIIAAFPITLPVDGAAHTFRVTHVGTAGHYLISDVVLVGSEEPNPILAMGIERPPVANAAALTAPNVAIYKGNLVQVTAMYKQVVAEFGNAVYVPSHMSANGLWSGDGLHPNDRGEEERALDALTAILNSYIRAWLFGQMLANTPNSEFPIV